MRTVKTIAIAIVIAACALALCACGKTEMSFAGMNIAPAPFKAETKQGESATAETKQGEFATAEMKQGELAAEQSETANITGENFDREQLIRIALDNMKYSYAPYSNFNVSTAVLMSSGKIYTGVNVENASYPAGICAERNAIFHAIACGEKQIVAIAIVGGKNGEIKDYCAPCGVCRQVIREFCDPAKTHVIFAMSATDYKDMTLEELLPESFGPANLQE